VAIERLRRVELAAAAGLCRWRVHSEIHGKEIDFNVRTAGVARCRNGLSGLPNPDRLRREQAQTHKDGHNSELTGLGQEPRTSSKRTRDGHNKVEDSIPKWEMWWLCGIRSA
jgi:hypothetical protein